MRTQNDHLALSAEERKGKENKKENNTYKITEY
jgi:hypothetical protein